jgi:hypothetical protein
VATASHLQAAEPPLIGTYKLLILEHYLPMIAFRSSLLQACITRPPSSSETKEDRPGFAGPPQDRIELRGIVII